MSQEEAEQNLSCKSRTSKKIDWNHVSSNTGQSTHSEQRKNSSNDQSNTRNLQNDDQSERKKVTEMIKHVELL